VPLQPQDCLGLILSILTALLLLEVLHELFELLSIQGVEIEELGPVLDLLDLLHLNVIEELPLALLDVAQVEEVVEDDIIEFETLGLIDCQAEHVLEDLWDVLLGCLITDDEYLVAAELRCSYPAISPIRLGDARAREERAEVVGIQGHDHEGTHPIAVRVLLQQLVDSLWDQELQQGHYRVGQV
jgi:hypothetical protein